VCELTQGILALVFIWTVELYSLIQNTIFVNLSFDVLVVVGFIRWRWRERKKDSSSTAAQQKRSFKVRKKYYQTVISVDFVDHNCGCFLTFSNVLLFYLHIYDSYSSIRLVFLGL